jgi:hypothetical protein
MAPARCESYVCVIALATLAELHATAADTSIDSVLPTSAPAPAAMAYLLDADSEGVVSASFAEVGFIDRDVMHGSIDTAIEELSRRSWPRFLIVDISGISDPLPRINRLAEICNLETEVIVVGERNDIVLYRVLKAAGVAEYFYKPLVGNLISRALDEIATGGSNPQPSRSGMLVFVVGVRGGVGVTTIATSLAWYFAEIRQRGVLLLDLDLHAGDAALQLADRADARWDPPRHRTERGGRHGTGCHHTGNPVRLQIRGPEPRRHRERQV